MYTVITVFIVIICLLLAMVVLVQNSKGGGLASGFSSSNQVMGVRKTTDVLEKGTWIFAGVIGALCLLSVLFISGGKSSGGSNKATEAPVPTSSQPATNPGNLTVPTTTPTTTPATNPK